MLIDFENNLPVFLGGPLCMVFKKLIQCLLILSITRLVDRDTGVVNDSLNDVSLC